MNKKLSNLYFKHINVMKHILLKNNNFNSFQDLFQHIQLLQSNSNAADPKIVTIFEFQSCNRHTGIVKFMMS